MSQGAYSFHHELRSELARYIVAQYFNKTPILNEVAPKRIDAEGLLYRAPFIEATPIYKQAPGGFQQAQIPKWTKDFLLRLADKRLGVFSDPYVHQLKALEDFGRGKDLFVSTGTGSGKTECFLWPILTKLVQEAKERPDEWERRGVRALVVYPMNALVADQVSRLRKTLGDKDGKFIDIFRNTCGWRARRPQFGMYTGRTPYPGAKPHKADDVQIADTLDKVLNENTDGASGSLKEQLINEGRIPAKVDLNAYVARLRASDHTPDPEDAELTTRFEMHKACPDLLITNYSMLEYMLFRPIEEVIWRQTAERLRANPNEKFLIVIDEAHMYRGSAGGEVALLFRRLFHKLGIDRSRVQFIMTTASMPSSTADDLRAVQKFALDFTSSPSVESFSFIRGEQVELSSKTPYALNLSACAHVEPGAIEEPKTQLEELNRFWSLQPNAPSTFAKLEDARAWLYDHMLEYRQFNELARICRGQASSLDELRAEIIDDASLTEEKAKHALDVLLAIAPLAQRQPDGAVLFPIRMHMLFRGITGVYVCVNPNCPKSHTADGVTLGEIYLSDGRFYCKECGSVVYELCNDRRCGALFLRGFALEENVNGVKPFYLWRYPGQWLVDKRMKELHLYIPPKDYEPPVRKHKSDKSPKLCYLDVRSGYLYFDDALANSPFGVKLYLGQSDISGKPDLKTFGVCPHCARLFGGSQITTLSVKGNQPFYNLILEQFKLQPPVQGKENLENQGRKVLLFSDSRRSAAKLALDMSVASETDVAQKLISMATLKMEELGFDSLEDLYDFFCLAIYDRKASIFSGSNEEREEGSDYNNKKAEAQISQDALIAVKKRDRAQKRNRSYEPNLKTSINAPNLFKENLLEAYTGYNSLQSVAISWLEPTKGAIYDIQDELKENGVEASEEEIVEVFNAWYITYGDERFALGSCISDKVRTQSEERRFSPKYGIDVDNASKDNFFSEQMLETLKWNDEQAEASNAKSGKSTSVSDKWKYAIIDAMTARLQSADDNGPTERYLRLDKVRARFDLNHTWYRCKKCSCVTPYRLRDRCPSCGSGNIVVMTQEDYDRLSFWRAPILRALEGERLFMIDTEEHTAQISHKDERDKLWAKTEDYERRFLDIVAGASTGAREQNDDNEFARERPIDVLSCTTTMEVGVDVGSLVAIGLRNVPPMRENYQQRAGRAGRRGASLSTIITYCDGNPQDTLYYKDPAPMFRGDPRRPTIDVVSVKILQRHFNMLMLATFFRAHSVDFSKFAAYDFFNVPTLPTSYAAFCAFLAGEGVTESEERFLNARGLTLADAKVALTAALEQTQEKTRRHPELFGFDGAKLRADAMSLLDALYEEGVIPSYSFPKNVVSLYIDGAESFEVDRGLDVALSEYAPGRSLIVDKRQYQVGALYNKRMQLFQRRDASSFLDDGNYQKEVRRCSVCGWFGLAADLDSADRCPFCHEEFKFTERPMVRPWGFAPLKSRKRKLNEEYSSAQEPQYSTLPSEEEMLNVGSNINLRMAARRNQRIVMINRGPYGNGFTICEACGATFPTIEPPTRIKSKRNPLEGIEVDKKSFDKYTCKHSRRREIDLGYDFLTDMLVLEISFDDDRINKEAQKMGNPWLAFASRSLAEALRLVICRRLDVDYTELVAGYRERINSARPAVDIYLYDSLSSGAGYSTSVAESLDSILDETEALLASCQCADACDKCLKHYRNQRVHDELDRMAALQLLKWARRGELVDMPTSQEQFRYLNSLKSVFEHLGIEIHYDEANETITLAKCGKSVQTIVHPGMLYAPKGNSPLYISEMLIKYAKPYAMDKIDAALK